MIFYNFYEDRDKTILMWRTNEGWSEFQQDLLMFNTKEDAQKDFYSILYDNEEFRQGEYFDTAKKEKKKKESKKADVKSDNVDKNVSSKEIPMDFKLEIDKVYNLKAEVFMNEVPKGYFDYIVTSPPYNVGERLSFGKNNAIYKGDEGMYDDYEDAMTPEEYEAWLFGIIWEMMRVTKKHVFMNIQMLAKNKETIFEIFNVFKKHIKEVMIWEKTIASPNINKQIMTSVFEFIFVFSNVEPQKRNFVDLVKPAFKNVIRGLNSSQNKYRHLNKATYPLYLPRTIIQAFGKPKDIWYDPFMGTGTTAHACELEDRHWVGTELDADQVESTNKRLWVEENQSKLDFSAGEEIEML